MAKILKFNPSTIIDEEITYEDILYMINNSKSYDDIIDTVDEFIDESREKQERLAILISICRLLPENNPYYIKYKGYIDAIYEMEKFNIDAFIRYCSDNDTLVFLKEGFYFIIEDYSNNPIAMEYLANRFIMDVLEKYNIDLEYELHKKFKKYEDLEIFGINKYLISLINKYDTNLGSYIMCHINISSALKLSLASIKDNWNTYKAESTKIQRLILLPKKQD